MGKGYLYRMLRVWDESLGNVGGKSQFEWGERRAKKKGRDLGDFGLKCQLALVQNFPYSFLFGLILYVSF